MSSKRTDSDGAQDTEPWWYGQENVVISGISCRFPESDNVSEFAENLMNGVDMVTEDERRWEPGNAMTRNKQKLS